MSKFKMRLKLTGFELDIEGSREDIPLIAQNVGQQIAGLLAPASKIVSGEKTDASSRTVHPIQTIVDVSSARRKRKRLSIPPIAGAQDAEKAPNVLNWKHDSSKWNSPNQSWSTLDKALWLIYVAEQETQQTELTVRQIAETFNTHFKQAKTVRIPNVTRDMGNKKAGKDALVGENATISPSKWYLTESGKSRVTKLIAEGKS